jgi:hypothetical protein
VVIEPQHPLPLPPLVLPTHKPISHCTCTHAPAPLAFLTAKQLFHNCVTYHIPTTKFVCKAMLPAEADGFAYLCQALTLVGGPEALLILKPSTGKFLKHRQLLPDPRYKATWDTSYAN